MQIKDFKRNFYCKNSEKMLRILFVTQKKSSTNSYDFFGGVQQIIRFVSQSATRNVYRNIYRCGIEPLVRMLRINCLGGGWRSPEFVFLCVLSLGCSC